MDLKGAIQKRISDLCKERLITPNTLAYSCGISPSTIYSILGTKSKSPEINTIKIICDGLGITLAEFFSDKVFDNLEQQIK